MRFKNATEPNHCKSIPFKSYFRSFKNPPKVRECCSFLDFGHFSENWPTIQKILHATSQNKTKLRILGSMLANTASSWHYLGPILTHLETKMAAKGQIFRTPKAYFPIHQNPSCKIQTEILESHQKCHKNILSSANLANLPTIKSGCMLGPLFASKH